MDLTVTLQAHAQRTALFGPNDRNLRLLREMFGVQLVARDGAVKLCGKTEAVGKTASVIEKMQQMLLDRDQLEVADVHEALAALDLEIEEEEPRIEGEIVTDTIEVFREARRLSPRRPVRRSISAPWPPMIWFFAWVRRERARPIWPWPWGFRP